MGSDIIPSLNPADDADFPEMSPTPFTPTNKRVAYFYDQDVGNYVYYLGHPMKPHRIRMAHNLIVNYGMCEDAETEADNQLEGARRVNDPIYGANGLAGSSADVSMDGADEKYDKAVAKGARSTTMQCFRPRRATKNDMTRFHTDEYVDLLEMVNPDNGESLTGGGMRCELKPSCNIAQLTKQALQETIVRRLRVSSNSAPSQQEVL
jgi:histone deacetylase 1/2